MSYPTKIITAQILYIALLVAGIICLIAGSPGTAALFYVFACLAMVLVNRWQQAHHLKREGELRTALSKATFRLSKHGDQVDLRALQPFELSRLNHPAGKAL